MSEEKVGNKVNEWFFPKAHTIEKASVMEIGTRRWRHDFPTHHREWFPNAETFTMVDFMEGEDVDMVADAHKLTDVFNEDSFDIVFAASLFEHLSNPWIAAEQILKVLKKGGLFYVQTHQSFPIHGYPQDFFRYTREGLEVLFEKASFKVSDYEFPCEIHSNECRVQKNCFINVCIGGTK